MRVQDPSAQALHFPLFDELAEEQEWEEVIHHWPTRGSVSRFKMLLRDRALDAEIKAARSAQPTTHNT